MITTMLITEGWIFNMTIEYVINKVLNHRFKIKLDDANNKSIINDLIDNLNVMEELYQSRYNDYIVYDSEPGCLNGFRYIAEFEVTERYIDFIMYLIQKRIDDINKLEGCLMLQYKGVN